MKTNVYLQELGLVCALGSDKQTVAAGFFSGDLSGMKSSAIYNDGNTNDVLGLVQKQLPLVPLEGIDFQSRNNMLLEDALLQILPAVQNAISKFGKHRIGVVIGTSTSGIDVSDRAFDALVSKGEFPPEFRYAQMEIGSPTIYLRRRLDLYGPAVTISTACSSGAKALEAGARYLRQGLCDAVIAGGVDSLCRYTIEGFRALEALSSEPCLPFSKNRKGINLGDGACLFLMSQSESEILLEGAGESSDAHHFSSPHPEGLGAFISMSKALEQAGCRAENIDYLNLHGTATLQNDAMESRAVYKVLGDKVPCSSTKAITGHTLGAAGALEAGACWLTLSGGNRLLPPNISDGVRDDSLPDIQLIEKGQTGNRLERAMTNSFGFGGSNCTLILRKA